MITTTNYVNILPDSGSGQLNSGQFNTANVNFCTGSLGGTITSNGSSTIMIYPNGANSFQYIQPYNLRIKRLDQNATIPTRANPGDLGFDLYALEDTVLKPGAVTKVRTGIACGFPNGYGALLRDRSSVATNQQVFVVAGVIDNGYRGEVLVAMYNPGKLKIAARMDMTRAGGGLVKLDNPVTFKKGDKIAQMILMPVVWTQVREVTELDDTTRGTNGFGSSGR